MIPLQYKMGAGALAMLGAWLWLQHGLREAREEGRAEVRAEWDAAVKAQQEVIHERQSNAVVTYRLELGSGADLRPISVRLCPPAPVGIPDPASGTEEAAAPAAGVPDLPAGDRGERELGPALESLMREADEVSARLRAVQSMMGR